MTVIRFALLTLVCGLATAAVAQDEVKKQKVVATENLDRASVSKPAVVETANLMVYSTLTEEKTKPVADAAQRAVDAAKKALRFTDKDTLWPGKLVVYALPDRKDFNTFARLVENRKVDADETRSVTVRGGEPYALVTAPAAARQPDGAVREEAAVAVATAVLDLKAGAGTGAFTLPGWFRNGFGKAVALRLNPPALDAHRAKVRTLFARNRLTTFQAADLWTEGSQLKDADTYAVSLVEYLVFGADAAKFGKFLGGFKPSDDRQMPDVTTALEQAEWKPDALDVAWKTWVLKQK
jgi:hypothetical protein